MVFPWNLLSFPPQLDTSFVKLHGVLEEFRLSLGEIGFIVHMEDGFKHSRSLQRSEPVKYSSASLTGNKWVRLLDQGSFMCALEHLNQWETDVLRSANKSWSILGIWRQAGSLFFYKLLVYSNKTRLHHIISKGKDNFSLSIHFHSGEVSCY